MLLLAEASSTSIIDIMAGFPFWLWIVFAGMGLSLIFGLTQMFMNHRERIEQIRHGQVPPKQDE